MMSISHLCLSGDLLRLRREDRERRLGDIDLRLRGERLILRREGALGLFSRDLSLPGAASGRERFLYGCSTTSTHLLHHNNTCFKNRIRCHHIFLVTHN